MLDINNIILRKKYEGIGDKKIKLITDGLEIKLETKSGCK